MIHLQNTKHVDVLLNASTASTATTTTSWDTLGYDYSEVIIKFGSQSATTAPIACKLSEGDTSTAFTDITDFVGGTATSTSAGWVIPSVVAAGGSMISLGVNHKAPRKRYLCLSVTPGTTCVLSGHAIMGRAEIFPTSTTARGLVAVQNA